MRHNRKTSLASMLFASAVLVAASVAWPVLAQAEQVCNDAWFMRNLIAHRGGHCFSSNLGKGMFGNKNCRPAGAKLSKSQRAQMASILQVEKDWSCSVDTGQRTIPIYTRRILERLEFFPIRDDTESSCLGYLGDEIALRAGPSENAPIVGSIARGSNVGDSHLMNGDWAYNEVYRGGEMVASGWHRADLWDNICESYAG